jgi:membrane-bound lytic murein transglycosylase B
VGHDHSALPGQRADDARPASAPRRHWLRAAAGLGAAAAATLAAPGWTWAQGAAPGGARRAPPAPTYARHPAALALADALTERHGLPAGWVRDALAQARLSTAVQRLIAPPPPGSSRNWAAYRARFVEPRRVQAGVDFWLAHERWFERAQMRFGVPAALVAGIIGVETFYGRFTGQHRVLDALATLAFDFPPSGRDRSAYFRDELEAFLLWCHAEGRPPAEPMGSFAGAMGLPQFMPSNIGRHGLDFDGDGHIDLLGSPADAIGSVARYLADHDWRPGMPTHFGVAAPVDSADRAHLLAPDIRPTFTAAEMAARGAVLEPPGDRHEGPLALVELQNGERASSFVAGTENFWTVTRYNRSSYYALAVIDLGAAVEAARGALR